jgi:hypothetical protein
LISVSMNFTSANTLASADSLNLATSFPHNVSYDDSAQHTSSPA